MNVLLQILAALLPFLFDFLGSFLRNMEMAKADDPSFLDGLYQIVRGVWTDHPDKSEEEKWQMAFEAAKVLAVNKEKVLRDSAVDALIALARDKWSATQVASVSVTKP